VQCFAEETPAYPTPPEIRLWCPGGAFLSPVEVSLQRRSINALPDPDLVGSTGHGRLIKGVEIVLKGLPSLPPRVAPGSQFTLEIPYEDGLSGYDHLFEGRDPDYGAAEEMGLHPVIWDPRTETWLDVDLPAVGGGLWLDPAGNVVTTALPTHLLNAFVGMVPDAAADRSAPSRHSPVTR